MKEDIKCPNPKCEDGVVELVEGIDIEIFNAEGDVVGNGSMYRCEKCFTEIHIPD